ncbi:MAG TPA: cupin domain-containing protein [Chthoniobacterales bacterium]|nr:cupin domain-containing protein [Chthoniobacterales bacterium]
MKTFTALLLFAAAIAISSLAFAVDQAPAATSEHVVFNMDDIKWGDAPPSLPAGAKASVLEGDPAKAGPFTIRLKMPSGYKVLPHTHPTAEAITVLSGSFAMGTGAKFDEAAIHAMSAGAFALMPAGTQHFAWCKNECVIQVSSTGPFVINYVNPADDPRGAKK